jgi:hypothetical protein
LGATVLSILSMLYLMARAYLPAGVVYFFPTDADVKDLSKTKAEPLIQRNYWRTLCPRPGDVYLKKFNDRWIFFRGTVSTVRMKMLSADVAFFDEADEISAEAQKVAQERIHASPIQWQRHFSIPSVPDYGIDKSFLASDQRYWTFRCRGCGHTFDLEHSFPDCLKVEPDGRVTRCCPKCHKPIRMEQGRWVAQNPGSKIVGFHLTQLLSPTINLAELLAEFRITDRMGPFTRGRLGLPYVEAAGKVDKSDVTNLCDGPARISEAIEETFFGVDVGKVFHWWAVARPKTGERVRTIGMGEEGSPEAIMRRMALMRCRRAVFDAQPEPHLVQKIQEAIPGKVWACYYSEATPVPPVWTPDPMAPSIEVDFWKVTCHRTMQLDRLFGSVRATDPKELIFPRRDALMEEVATHFSNLVRIAETDEETGAIKYRYVRTGPDHYAHAALYAHLAAGTATGPIRSVIFGPR